MNNGTHRGLKGSSRKGSGLFANNSPPCMDALQSPPVGDNLLKLSLYNQHHGVLAQSTGCSFNKQYQMMTASAATNNGSIYGFSEMKTAEQQTKHDPSKENRAENDSSILKGRADKISK